MVFTADDSSLTFRHGLETLRIQAWGPNALRVRCTREPSFPLDDWALDDKPPAPSSVNVHHDDEKGASISNGRVTATVSAAGKLTVTKSDGEKVLEEFARNRDDPTDPNASALQIAARDFQGKLGTESFHLTARFESPSPDERIYGMGQYQQPFLNLKGTDLELAQRNSQASVPFFVSSLGYGFLWNNPSIGRVVFGKNQMTFEASSTRVLDYWITVGDAPADIVRAYTDVTGKAPKMPEYGLGFWQCKLRYQTQEELLQVARKHRKELGLPMDVIVADFFHWPYEGEWKFDPTYWPDPAAMVAELKEMGVELMVSVWPTVDRNSENYKDMLAKGLLISQDRGPVLVFEHGHTSTTHFDATNPAARAYVWEKAKQNYHDKGVKLFWLDEAEPEFSRYDFDNYRYFKGPNQMIGNMFPRFYSQGFYEGMKSVGQDEVVNLVRCAWAGSQKYGALLWSGDIASSWTVFRNQLAAGLNAGMAGISWWTTDIGGFHGGDPNDPAFRELFVRWFQWGAFCPVFRLHGDREPRQPQHGTTGGAACRSGAANEVWSYGEEVFKICKNYIHLRENMRSYVRSVTDNASTHGDPVIRPLFYEFPADPKAWDVETEYMFGSKYLVAPIMKPGQRRASVYLPGGARWRLVDSAGSPIGQIEDGGREVEVDAPLEYMPVFERAD